MMTNAPTLTLGDFHRFQAAREDFLYLAPSAALFRLDDQASAILNALNDGPVQGDELVVPPDRYFAMGDNRDHSLDSRYWGFVDRSAIMGRPFLIFWSVNATSADYGQSTFVQRLRGVFDTLAHLPTRTRWSRMLHTVH